MSLAISSQSTSHYVCAYSVSAENHSKINQPSNQETTNKLPEYQGNDHDISPCLANISFFSIFTYQYYSHCLFTSGSKLQRSNHQSLLRTGKHLAAENLLNDIIYFSLLYTDQNFLGVCKSFK